MRLIIKVIKIKFLVDKTTTVADRMVESTDPVESKLHNLILHWMSDRFDCFC